MSEYAGVAGFVQFDPKTDRVVNGAAVTDVTVKAIGSQKLVSITIWPEFLPGIQASLGRPIAKGDWVAADGQYNSNTKQAQDGSWREYISVSAGSLAVAPGVAKIQRQVVQAPVQQQAAPVQQVAPVVQQAAPVAAPVTQGAPF